MTDLSNEVLQIKCSMKQDLIMWKAMLDFFKREIERDEKIGE